MNKPEVAARKGRGKTCDILALFGFVLLECGIAMVHVPTALIVAGILSFLAAVGLSRTGKSE